MSVHVLEFSLQVILDYFHVVPSVVTDANI